MTWRHLLMGPIALAAVLLAMPALAQLPPLTSEAQDAAAGAQAHAGLVQQFGGVYDDPQIGAYVAQVGARLLAAAGQQGKEYTFTVLDSDLPNAFALPGGFAYITRGMLALINTEAELAGVMGHEIGHVIARHSAERQTGGLIAGLLAGAVGALTKNSDVAQLAGLLGQGALASYSRQQEYEADELGIKFMRAGGWNPLAQGDMLSALKRSSDLMQQQLGGQSTGWGDFFASHPNTLERISRAVALAREGGVGGDYGRERWMRATDGLMYMGSPRSGYIRGQRFLHPQLAVTFAVPAGWVLANQATAVTAQGRDGVMVFDTAPPQSGRYSPYAYIRNSWFKPEQVADAKAITVNGMPAAIALLRSQQAAQQGKIALVAAIQYAQARYYRFQFIVPERQGTTARDVIFSLRRLGWDELRNLYPWRIRVFRVDPGDTIASLSAMMAVPRDKEQTFRLLNALDAGMQVRPGDLVKIVRDGPMTR